MKFAVLAVLISGAAAFTSNPIARPTFQSSSALSAKKEIKPVLKYVKCLDQKDIPKPGQATSGIAGGLAICIAVDKSGSIFALGDKCPPVGQPLSFGKIVDGCIEDPVLGTKFDLKTGAVVGKWCPSGIGLLLGGLFEPQGVPTYPVKKNGNSIEVQVDVNYKLAFEQSYWSGILDAQGKADGKYY